MSSVLHPVGPEPRERYWVRRLAVLVAVVVAIGIIIALVGNAMSAGSAVQAEPAQPTVVAPTLPAATSASPTPDGTASPQPSGSPKPGAATAPPTKTAPTTAAPTKVAPTKGGVVTPDPGQTAKTEKPTAPTQAEKKKAEAQAAEKKAAAKKKAADAKAKAPVLATCPSDDLRPTLTGPKTLKAEKGTTFAVSLINGSSKSCYLKVTSANFTLTVVSGKDRIWSTDDCPAAVPSGSRKLTPQTSLDWNLAWDGQRSAKGCSKQREAPKAGYYWAIANFDDAREVRWRVILT